MAEGPRDLVGRRLDRRCPVWIVAVAGGRDGKPGDQLILDVTVLRHKAGIYKFAARATVGEELACEAELMCTMRTIA